jgi:putative ABC transport system permease protein
MRFGDVCRLAVATLLQQKVRTGLTTLGVVIGTFVLTVSLSIGQGVRRVIAHELRRHDQLRKILVFTGNEAPQETIPREVLEIKGNISEAKRERLRRAIVRRWQGKPRERKARLLTHERVRELRELDHVEAVVPNLTRHAVLWLDGKAQGALAVAADPGNTSFRERVVAGSFLEAGRKGVLVSEYVLYRWGIVEDEAVEGVLGRRLRLEYHQHRPGPANLLALLNAGRPRLSGEEERVLEKALARLPDALEAMDLEPQERATLARLLHPARPRTQPNGPRVVAEELPIIGIFRDPTRAERLGSWEGLNTNYDAYVPVEVAQEMYDRVPANRKAAFSQATVRVDSEDNVKEVQQQISDMGLETYSLADVVEQIRFNAMVLALGTGLLAVVALVVAGLGITNTMLMSVLERTHEIGVMKAVGARDGEVQRLFLVEGTLIGLAGGLLGLLASWLASFPGDRVARSLAERHTPIKLEESLFVFPSWLILGVPLFVSVLTMLAAVYPARCAARVNPITALRHE